MNAVAERKARVVRAAIYVRISADYKGEGLGVGRQLDACRALIRRRTGWAEVEVYEDNDTSATTGKPRPEFQRMLDDIEAGHLDAVVCWDQDRLVRQPAELEAFIDLVNRKHVDLANHNVEFCDLSTPHGRLTARQFGAYAAFEGEHKALRMKAMWKQRAAMGKPHMGGPRPYGYLPDRVTVDPVEGAYLRDAAERVLAGESLRSVANDMTASGARTVTGKAWSAPLLKQVLKAARLSGRREVGTGKGLGEIVATDCWEAVITPEQSDRLRTLLTDPTRQAHTRHTRASHLLTGLLRCGRCGGRMTALAWEKGNRYLYRCPSPGAGCADTCGKVSVLMKYAEPVVRNLALTAIDAPDFYERLHARAEVDPAVVAQVRDDEQRLADLAGMFATGDLSKGEWQAAREAVQARLAANKRTMERAVNTDALARLAAQAGEHVEDRWEALNTAQQRAVLHEVFEQVVVQPAGGKGLVFDPERLVPTYRF